MFTEDLTAFFQTADFATAATYKVAGIGSGSTKNVIYDRAALDSLGIVSGTNPVALAIATDFTGWGDTDTLTIGGVIFTIRDSKPQDDGATVLLELSAP